MLKSKKYILLSCFAVLITLIVIVSTMALWNKSIETTAALNTDELSQKIKDAILGDGTIELTEDEVNAGLSFLIKNSDRLKGRVKQGHVDLIQDKLEFQAITPLWGREFFVQCTIKPAVQDGDIIINIESIRLGKLPIPKGLAMNFIKRYLPENIKMLKDGSLSIGSQELPLEIQRLVIADDKIQIGLMLDWFDTGDKDPANAVTPVPSPTPTPRITPEPKTDVPKTEVNDKPQPTPAPTESSEPVDKEKLEEEILSKYTETLNSLRNEAIGSLNALAGAMMGELNSQPPDKRSDKLFEIGLKYMKKGQALEKQYDDRFYSILNQMKTELAANDLPLDAAYSAENQYKSEKAAKRKEIINSFK